MANYRSEFVIALTCAVGTDSRTVQEVIARELTSYGYQCTTIKISKALLEPLDPHIDKYTEYQRINKLMDLGNQLRRESKDNGILAKGAIHQITNYREEWSTGTYGSNAPLEGTVYVIDSLKNPEEVKILREVYTTGFYLFAINEAERLRIDNMIDVKNIGREDAQRLVARDMEEEPPYGQKTNQVFELADFHLTLNGWDANSGKNSLPKNTDEKIRMVKAAKTKVISGQLRRVLALMFGSPFITPTFDEYAMFMAYSSGLRSADLSRQVGAVIATPIQEIIATGANDCPKFGGGQYWPHFDLEQFEYMDDEGGRDYMIGYDSNKREFQKLVEEILNIFNYSDDEKGRAEREEARERMLTSRIKQLTEYGRPVHAEMNAILSCARTGISLQNATLYCSTFPCHNCAKHIIGAGITRVVYIEPYPKSKSLELYPDSMVLSEALTGNENGKVRFQEFVGIGPRRFYDLFSMRLSSGYPLVRKKSDGSVADWDCKKAELRCIMAPTTYFEREMLMFTDYLNYLKDKGEQTVQENAKGSAEE